ncbi:hypothetical protein OIU78_026891 [Salix suchowensis]|nr:hypothetical protein OIU78_026891 [Salix suchowensis]
MVADLFFLTIFGIWQAKGEYNFRVFVEKIIGLLGLFNLVFLSFQIGI